MNERQQAVLRKLMGGSHGKLTTSKYAKLAKCSHDTALRDVQSLVDQGLLTRGPGAGRSTHYVMMETGK